MPIVKYKNQSRVTYAYEQTSMYDPEKKQSRPIRKYLGKVDPETGEIISTKGKRGRPPKQQTDMDSGTAAQQDFRSMYEQKCRELEKLQGELSAATEENNILKARIREFGQMISSIQAQISSII